MSAQYALFNKAILEGKKLAPYREVSKLFLNVPNGADERYMGFMELMNERMANGRGTCGVMSGTHYFVSGRDLAGNDKPLGDIKGSFVDLYGKDSEGRNGLTIFHAPKEFKGEKNIKVYADAWNSKGEQALDIWVDKNLEGKKVLHVEYNSNAEFTQFELPQKKEIDAAVEYAVFMVKFGLVDKKPLGGGMAIASMANRIVEVGVGAEKVGKWLNQDFDWVCKMDPNTRIPVFSPSDNPAENDILQFYGNSGFRNSEFGFVGRIIDKEGKSNGKFSKATFSSTRLYDIALVAE